MPIKKHMSSLKRTLPSLALIIILAVVYLFNAAPFSGWMVDDAGVSLSYARNLAAGYGLVSQPGQPPVEGFSNPLWVFLLSVFSLAGMQIIAIVQPLSLALAALALLVMFFALRQLGIHPVYAFTALLALVCQPSFIIWSVSGLENALYVLLIALLLWVTASPYSPARAALAGGFTGAIALTRPEGILYAVLYPLLLRKGLKQYLPAPVVIFGGYLAFRLAYFGVLMANPYYKKSEQFFSSEWWVNLLAKSKGLLLGLFGSQVLLAGVTVMLLLAMLLLLRKKSMPRALFFLGAFCLVALAGYLLLPKDWMGEYRYATPIFMTMYPLMAAVLAAAGAAFASSYPRWLGVVLLGAWLGAAWLTSFAPRVHSFRANPTIALSGVAESFRRFEAYGGALGLPSQRLSVLTPDVGGALYYFSHIRIDDLGGLVDPIMARTFGRDDKALHDYIFSKQPAFIDLHGGWSFVAKLENDPRFRRDYVAIFEYVDSSLKDQYPQSMHSGDYVRRDLLTTPDMLLVLQKLSPSWKQR